MNMWNKTISKIRNNPLTSGEWRKLIDRRGTPRRSVELPVEVHVDAYPSNVRINARLRDVSEHGAFVRSLPYPLNLGELLTLAIGIDSARSQHCAPVPATVIRSDQEGVALRFAESLDTAAKHCLAELCRPRKA